MLSSGPLIVCAVARKRVSVAANPKHNSAGRREESDDDTSGKQPHGDPSFLELRGSNKLAQLGVVRYQTITYPLTVRFHSGSNSGQCCEPCTAVSAKYLESLTITWVERRASSRGTWWKAKYAGMELSEMQRLKSAARRCGYLVAREAYV
jgi:hypothetical protein